MSGEMIYAYGAIKTLESSGSQIASGALAKATVAPFDVVVDGGGFPDADIVFSCAFGVAPVENTFIGLYARQLGTDGEGDADVPETTRPGAFVGSWRVNNVLTPQVFTLSAEGLPRKAEYYIFNMGTGQAINAGWSLKVKPRSYKPAV